MERKFSLSLEDINDLIGHSLARSFVIDNGAEVKIKWAQSVAFAAQALDSQGAPILEVSFDDGEIKAV